MQPLEQSASTSQNPGTHPLLPSGYLSKQFEVQDNYSLDVEQSPDSNHMTTCLLALVPACAGFCVSLPLTTLQASRFFIFSSLTDLIR